MNDVALLDRVLSASGSADAPCPITADGLRLPVVEYLDDYDSELARFPEQAVTGRWNLWLGDEPGEFEKDCYFVAVVVGPAGLAFACGSGPQEDVRDFADENFPDDVWRVIPDLVRRFTMPHGPVVVDRLVAEAWLGRRLGVPADLGGPVRQ